VIAVDGGRAVAYISRPNDEPDRTRAMFKLAATLTKTGKTTSKEVA
jgi:hypothetical protein